MMTVAMKAVWGSMRVGKKVDAKVEKKVVWLEK
jgi:hypothetical protein